MTTFTRAHSQAPRHGRQPIGLPALQAQQRLCRARSPQGFASRRFPTGHSSAFTLIEALVATALASIVTIALLASYSMTTRGFSAAGNYSDMEREARLTMDNLTRDLRQATGLTAFASSDITIAVATNFSTAGAVTGAKTVRYYRGSGANTNYLYRADGSITDQLASSVSSINFIAYDRNLSTNGILPSDTKLVQVDLTLRKYTIDNPNTEQILSARVVLRNKLLP